MEVDHIPKRYNLLGSEKMRVIRKTHLTLKQEAFVEAYLRLQKGRKANKKANDNPGKMSNAVAYTWACQDCP